MMCAKLLTVSLRAGLLLFALLCAAQLRAEEPATDPVGVSPSQAVLDPKIKVLIAQLGAADTVQREEAEKAILALGKSAVAQLKEAEASPNPEIAFRAKRLNARLAEVSIRPQSYANILPSDSVFFFEFRDAPTTLDRFKLTPLGQFWEKQTTRAFVKGHRATLLANELKVLDAISVLPKLASGKAFFALSSPDNIEAHEIDPPLLYVLETKDMQAVEAQVRNMFEGMNDAVKTKRQYNKFQIEEQNNACTVFGSERVIHALTPKGMENFLDYLQKPAEKPLSLLLTDLKTKRPNADAYLRVSADGFPVLAEANQLFDDEQAKTLEAAGFAEGGFIEDALTLNTEGVEEFARFSAGGDTRNKGVLALLQRMTLKAAPPLQANQPQALDLIPFQAAMVASFSGDVAKHSAELAAALRAVDAMNGQPIHPEPNVNAAAPKTNEAVAPPRPPAPKTRAEDALNLGGGNVLNDKKEMKTTAKDPKAKDADKKAAKKEKPAELERSMPHIERLLKAGFKLEQLFDQADGPMVLALFPERVNISKLANPGGADNPPDPERVPMAALFGMYLKDPAPIELALEKANKGINPLYHKTVLNGGSFYSEEQDEEGAGFWIQGKYLAYGTSKDIVELAGAAVLNQNGTERMSARKSYLDYMANFNDPKALLNVYADSRQFMEMPYKMAQLQWQSDPKNPWPDFTLVAGLLKGNTMRLKVTQAQGGLQIEAQTPISILGLLEAVLKPLKEAVLIQ